MGRPSFRRRKFFIKKEFQGKFIAIYTVGVIALAGITTLVLNSWLHKVVDEQLYSSHMKVQRTGELFLTPLIQTNLYAMLGMSLLVLLFSVVVFKRLNKHFFRMDEAFNAMAIGNYGVYEPVSSHFEELNEMIDMVSRAQDNYGEKAAELATLTSEIDSAIESGCKQSQIKALHDRLVAAIDNVSLPDNN